MEWRWHVLFELRQVHRVTDQRCVGLGETVDPLLQLIVGRHEVLVAFLGFPHFGDQFLLFVIYRGET